MVWVKMEIPAILDREQSLASSSSSDLARNAVTDELVNRYERQIVWRPQNGAPVEAKSIPNQEERRLLNGRLLELRSACRPSSLAMTDRERVGAAIARMFAGYPSQRNADARATIATYVLELGSHPAWAVERACEAVRAGKVEGLNPDFPPSSIRMNQITEIETSTAKQEASQIEALLAVVRAPSGRTPEEEARAEASATAWLERRDPRARALVPKDEENSERDRARRADTLEANRRFFARECAAAGISPDSPVSPSLLKIMKDRDSEGDNELG